MPSSTLRARCCRSFAAAVACLLLSPAAAAQEETRPGSRLAWVQEGNNIRQVRSYIYTLYVDGFGSRLGDVTCVALGGSTFECAAALPAMSPGTHRLELSTSVMLLTSLVESTRSEPIYVTVPNELNLANQAAAARPGSGIATVSEQPQVTDAEHIVSGLRDPVDLAFADGVAFVLEASGVVWSTHDRARRRATVPLQTSRRGVFVAMALHPQFRDTGHVFFVVAQPTRDAQLEYQVVRFRYAGEAFAERAVLLDGIPADPDRLAAAIRFGPDGFMYVAFASRSGHESSTLASYDGKLLRLTAEGLTPRDQVAHSPIVAMGLRSPRGMTWSSDGTLIVVDADQRTRAESRAANVRVLPIDGATSIVAMRRREMTNTPNRDDLLVTADGSLQMVASGASFVRNAALLALDRATRQQLEGARIVGLDSTGHLYVATGESLLRLGRRER